MCVCVCVCVRVCVCVCVRMYVCTYVYMPSSWTASCVVSACVCGVCVVCVVCVAWCEPDFGGFWPFLASNNLASILPVSYGGS